MILYQYPPQATISLSTGPVEFVSDGVATQVSQDTAAPSNSTPLPVIQLDSSGQVTTPLTDAQLRASPVPVSGPLTDTELRATAVPVTGPLTDTQLRAVAVPVSLASSPLPAGAATEAKQDDQIIEAQKANTLLKEINTNIGSSVSASEPDPAQPATVIAALKGVNQNLQTIDFSTSANQAAEAVLIGAVTETAPASDTASSGLNGRLQRIAQRITSLIAILPASLGQKTSTASLAVVIASNQSSLPVVQQALAGTFQEILNLTTSAQTFTAPANAKWCKIYADDTNAANVRVKIGGTATVSSGIQLQPGRAEDFSIAGNISVIAESGTNQKVNVHFGV